MSIKEIQARAGSFSGYLGYVVLMGCWYFLYNVYTSNQSMFAGNWVGPALDWGIRIVIIPFLMAGLYGGIHEQQQTQESWDMSAFFTGIKKHFWRLAASNLLGFIFLLILTTILFIVGVIKQSDTANNNLLIELLSIPYTMVMVSWSVAITVERKLFPALFQGIKFIILNPFALLIILVWGVIGFADTYFFDSATSPVSLPVNGLRAAAMAVIRVLVAVYCLAIYKQSKGYALDSSTEDDSLAQASSASTGGGLTNAAFGFTLLSFLPVLHLVSLTLGILAILRKKSFGIRTVVACCFGGFFTVFYALMLVGWLISGTPASKGPGYAFLAEADAGLKPQAQLLEKGSYSEALKQLQAQASSSNSPWAVDCALALAKSHTFNSKGALEDFYRAAGKKPERSEFYYYYGVALLENNQTEKAGEQFQAALEHQPRLDEAERYLTLINTAYTPSKWVSSLLFIIILLVMFSFHEYGHASVAWKLGDNTAEQQGRLTLNPLRHLDLFGSVILPAILIFQQSSMVFGWARPVPVDPRNFKDPQKDHMRVAFAGPTVNLFFSMACFIILGCMMLVIRIIWPNTLALNIAEPFAPVSLVGPSIARWLVVVIAFIKQLFYSSLVLGFLNLIPIPPLDGSWVLSGLLPSKISEFLENMRRFGNVFFLALVLTPALNYFLSIPLSIAMGCLQLLISAMRFG